MHVGIVWETAGERKASGFYTTEIWKQLKVFKVRDPVLSPSEVHGQPSEVCERRSPPAKLSGVEHQLFLLLHLKNSWSKHKGSCCKEVIMLRFLAMQFSLGSRHFSLLHKENKFFLAVYSTQKELWKIHSHDFTTEREERQHLEPMGAGREGTTAGLYDKRFYPCFRGLHTHLLNIHHCIALRVRSK